MAKNGKKIMQLKWPKYQKPKDENKRWTKQMYHWLRMYEPDGKEVKYFKHKRKKQTNKLLKAGT